MMPHMETVIDSILHRDQDTVQVLLDTYNIQYAECFFYDTEVQERKKQQQLEEFRKNKVREPASDSDSDSDPDTDSDESGHDLLLRQRLATALLCFISGQLQPGVLRTCLHTLRILSRDRRGLEQMVIDCALFTLANLGGFSLSQTCLQQQDGEAEHQTDRGTVGGCEDATNATPTSVSDLCCKWRGAGGHVALLRGKKDTREEISQDEEKEEDVELCRKEAIKVLCNVIYNSPKAQERASTLRLLQSLWESLKQGIRSRVLNSCQFYKLRLLFLLTALRPELRLQLQQERGVSVLTKALEQCLAVRWDEGYDNTAPPISKDMSQDISEILKILFNITHTCSRQEPDEEDAALYRQLAAVLRHCLLMAYDGEDTKEEIQGHAVNILSALPLTCLDVLLSAHIQQASHKWEGVNMDCVHTLLLFMDRRMNKGQRLKEKLTPVLNLLTESSRVHRETRHYLRQKILPPLRNINTRPEQDTSLRGQLVRLMTHVDTDVKHCAAELLFVLCKENVSRFVKYTGYGNAAGLLAARGLLNGRRNSEYREAKARINLVTGRVEAEQPDPMEGMTEEEKEEEARNLIGMINRLSRKQIIQPMGVTAEGRLVPLWSQMRSSTQEEEEEEDLDLTSKEKKDKQME
ncbi:hypothetical protein Q5P01_016622 [Channa striata]|uniref:Synembryn n=1 Tax=Channa striata TaxID=64152 RepID=A0AA88SI48_CHASR|nr:hypothetical protein Q5P01_016622 [Channa striata]